MSDVAQEQATPSVEIGRRAAQHAEARMLIDGAASGLEFDNVSPATGLVLGAPAGDQDMERAIGAARRAFDETDRSLHEELIAEVGCPDMTIASAKLDWPLADRKVAGR